MGDRFGTQIKRSICGGGHLERFYVLVGPFNEVVGLERFDCVSRSSLPGAIYIIVLRYVESYRSR